MRDEIAKWETLTLENGMVIEYIPNSPKWAGQLFASNDFIPGEAGVFQGAANHLIEHCLSGPFSGFAETRSTFISHRLSRMEGDEEALLVLNLLGNGLTDIKLDSQTIAEQRRCIYEELAGQSQHTSQFKYFGGFFEPVTFDCKDAIIENVNPEKIYDFLNRQADYNNAFTEDELNKQARFMYDPSHLTLRIQTPLDQGAFSEFIKNTSLVEIPSRLSEKNYSDVQQIQRRDVPAQIDYRKIPVETLKYNFQIDGEGNCKDILCQMAKQAKKDAGLYWVKTGHQTNEKGDDYSFEVRITSQHKQALIDSMVHFLDKYQRGDNINENDKKIAQQIRAQIQGDSEQNKGKTSCRLKDTLVKLAENKCNNTGNISGQNLIKMSCNKNSRY